MAHEKSNGDSLLERLPGNILFDEILLMLDKPENTLTTLCTLTCVSRTLHSSINTHLRSLSSIDLSGFSMDLRTFCQIRKRFKELKKIKLDCLHLNDDVLSSRNFLGVPVEELILLKGSSLSSDFVFNIKKWCPNIRVLTVHLSSDKQRFFDFDNKLNNLLKDCRCLESLEIKVRREKRSGNGFKIPGNFYTLPKTLKILKLDMRVLLGTPTFGPTLTHISLVLDIITDILVLAIVNSCPILVELELIDKPIYSTSSSAELSNVGFQSLGACRHLTNLSLIRNQKNIITGFRTCDMDLLLLSVTEGCKGLESVVLDGFSSVRNAGFASILTACLNLKKFEIRNSWGLEDLTMKYVSEVHTSLVEVKLVSCKSITSKGVRDLVTSCTSLEVLDLFGCSRVKDFCIRKVSCLTLLTSLNLGGTEIRDDGMAILGKGNAPISCLSLRGCKWVTDKGITLLLRGEGKISKTLSSLDLGHMRVTDNAITMIADVCAGLIELCIRNCLLVMDKSIKALAKRGRLQHCWSHPDLLCFESNMSMNKTHDTQTHAFRLDIHNCPGIYFESVKYLKKPFFSGLKWIGIGQTQLILVADTELPQICRERPWLTICKDGCEVGCRDGW
ncbi:F-box domain, cyclin-like protein [Artemisia annua]|uniref:F-box domain, cyclin-like protein n=1 Tax=Artemisia annua TaxID=35608 RepID=A0A2U1L9Y1_ARTAN|nr:F-box domain, cyclin-like protein [Artemisia annua]